MTHGFVNAITHTTSEGVTSSFIESDTLVTLDKGRGGACQSLACPHLGGCEPLRPRCAYPSSACMLGPFAPRIARLTSNVSTSARSTHVRPGGARARRSHRGRPPPSGSFLLMAPFAVGGSAKVTKGPRSGGFKGCTIVVTEVPPALPAGVGIAKLVFLSAADAADAPELCQLLVDKEAAPLSAVQASRLNELLVKCVNTIDIATVQDCKT